MPWSPYPFIRSRITHSIDRKEQKMSRPRKPAIVWKGKFLRVMKVGRWEYAERVNAIAGVVIVAVTKEGNLLLTEQERLPVGKRVIELPAGLAGDVKGNETEELAVAAKRELLEETGYEAGELTWLTAGPPSPGLSSEMVTFFRATGLRRVSAGGGEGNEKSVAHEVPVRTCEKWLKDRLAEGMLVDPKVYVGLFFALPPKYP